MQADSRIDLESGHGRSDVFPGPRGRLTTLIVGAAIVEPGLTRSVGAVSDKLLEINATDDFGLIVAKNNGRAARRGAVPVLVRGPATLCRASSPFLSESGIGWLLEAPYVRQ